MNNSELANYRTHPTARRIGRLLAVVLVIITIMLTLTSMPASASKQTTARPAAPAQHTLLMTWHTDASEKGDIHYVTGEQGPCDSAGYTFYPNNYWGHRLSSIVGYNRCGTVVLTNREGQSQLFYLPVDDLYGTGYNDDVARVDVFCSPCP